MQEETKNFIQDLIAEIQEKYNQSLIGNEEESLENKSYRLGSNFSYYDILDVIQSQLELFNIPQKDVDNIVPVLGEKI
ncbi:MAG: hypothetical protein FWG64_12510 [Firmicutes bacterium]|nr:hypothetical protein [Bacillota bacterium]